MKNQSDNNYQSQVRQADMSCASIWYQHNADEDKVFTKAVATTVAAKNQIKTIYSLMRFLESKNQIQRYGEKNIGGFEDVSSTNEKIKTVIRDESDNDTSVETVGKEGDLRIWYAHLFDKPELFYSSVESPTDAVAQLLAIYELMLFLYENNQIADYCNAGGLEVYESDGEGGFEWCEWYSEDGLDIGEILAIDMTDDDANL